MATLIDVYHAQGNAELRNRVVGAVAVSAWNVFEETEPAPSVARLAWAKAALDNPHGTGQAMMWAVCANATVQAASFDPTDNDIQFIVNELRDAYAV
jgi:hypothetical protein